MIFSCKGNNQNKGEITKLTDFNAKLGEGALWDHQYQRLYWIDIEGKTLYLYYPDKQLNKAYPLPQRIGTVVPVSESTALVALEDGIYELDLENSELTKVAEPEPGITTNRFNDGKCDPAGRLWVGSMVLKGPKKRAALYMIDHDYTVQKMIDSVSTSNGIAWSLDSSKMYYIDTPTGKVVAYDFDIYSGAISNPVDAIVIPDSLGHPDGSTLDAEGMLWIAMWGGGCITRWNPETGEFLEKIDVPAKNVTSLAFGGKNLNELFITSASLGMNDQDKVKYPDAGGLFHIETNIKGIEAEYFR